MVHRVAVIDDHPVFREGLRAVLSSQNDLQVVAEAGDARSGYALLGTERHGLWSSADGGRTWTPVGSQILPNLTAVAANPLSANVLWAPCTTQLHRPTNDQRFGIRARTQQHDSLRGLVGNDHTWLAQQGTRHDNLLLVAA